METVEVKLERAYKDLRDILYGLNHQGFAWTNNEELVQAYIRNANQYHEYKVQRFDDKNKWLIEVRR